MAVKTVIDFDRVKAVLAAMRREFPGICFVCSPTDGEPLAQAKHESEPGPDTVYLWLYANKTFSERRRQCPDVGTALDEDDLPEVVAFVLLHEVGHYRLRHTARCHEREATTDEQQAADQWAECEYEQLAECESGSLRHLTPEELCAIRHLAGRR